MDELKKLLLEQQRCANRLSNPVDRLRYLEITDIINKLASATGTTP